MTGRSHPTRLGTSASADSTTATERDTRSARESRATVSCHAADSGRPLAALILRTTIHPPITRSDSAPTPINHANTSHGTVPAADWNAGAMTGSVIATIDRSALTGAAWRSAAVATGRPSIKSNAE